MRIDEQSPDLLFYRTYKRDLENLLHQPDDKAARPCPGCGLVCPTCGSTSCTCGCSVGCAQAPKIMSSDPEVHPIESGIVPLVYAFHSLRLTPPCWSCERHYGRTGKLDKLPRVWFYARSLAYPNLIAELIVEPKTARRLSQPWQISIVRWSSGVDVTLSIEPRIKANEEPRLDRLRQDVKIIAQALELNLKAISRQWITELRKVLGNAA